jgi:hypothetical protein
MKSLGRHSLRGSVADVGEERRVAGATVTIIARDVVPQRRVEGITV